MARFDRVIPPGGEGRAVLKIDLRGFQGRVHKSAKVISNDSAQPNALLTLQGVVRPLIEIKPGPFVQLAASTAGADEKTVDLLAADRDFQLLEVYNGLEGKIRVQWEALVPGRHYRLKISSLQKEGHYFGMVSCRTDHLKKPEVLIRVNGHFPNPRPKKNEH